MKKNNATSIFIFCIASLLANFLPAHAASHTGTLDALKAAIADSQLSNTFIQTGEITLDAALGNITTANSVLTLYGDSIHSINGNGFMGLTVASGQTLNINSTQTDSMILSTFKNFNSTSGFGSVIINNGTTNINNALFKDNSYTTTISVSGSNLGGSTIANNKNLNIYKSIFQNNTLNVTATSTNISTYGTLTLNNTGGTTNINDSLFSANLLTTTGSSASPYGAAIAVYTYANFGTLNILRSSFSNNIITATTTGSITPYARGGVISIPNGKGTASITDSFLNNNKAVASTATAASAYSTGGAIYATSQNNNLLTISLNNVKLGDTAGNISKATSTRNVANSKAYSYGGAIFNDNQINSLFTRNSKINISNNSLFKNNQSYSEISGPTSLAYSGGGAIYLNAQAESATGSQIASSELNITDTIFQNNIAEAKNTGSGTGYAYAYGGAIYNAATATLAASAKSITNIIGSEFTENSAVASVASGVANSYGGAIYNYQTYVTGVANAKLNVINTTFSSNSANNGGAIYNSLGIINLTNSSMNNNPASTHGGAIYSYGGTVSIIADGKNIAFSGNTGSNEGIYLTNLDSTLGISVSNPVLNLNAGNSGTLSLDDKINSNDINNTININKSGIFEADDVTTAPTSGMITLNNAVTNATVNILGGRLSLGSDNNEITSTYFNNANLNLTNGVLDMENNNVDDVLDLKDFNANPNASITLDANLNTGHNDKIIISGTATGALTINNIKILSDSSSTNSTMAVVTGGNLTNLAALPTITMYTTLAEYIFTQNATTKGTYDVLRTLLAGLNYAVKSTAETRTFEATTDTNAEYALGTMGGTNSTLTINGNSNNINGLNYGGITVLADQTLNINNIGSLNTDGTVKTSWNGFKGTDGGAINNTGNLSITNSVFSNNTTSEYGGVLYNNTASNITTTISGSTFANNNATNYGGAIYNANGTLEISDTDFTNNYTTNTAFGGGAIYNNNGILKISNGSTFIKNGIQTVGTVNTVKAGYGGAIYNDANGKTSTIDNARFETNAVKSYGGAIHNTAGTLQITDTDFIGNYTSTSGSGGGAINTGVNSILQISNGSTFISNGLDTTNTVASYFGGAIRNYSTKTSTIDDTKFETNAAKTSGGAIYNDKGTLQITNTDFTGNYTTSTTAGEGYGGAIYNNDVIQISQGSTFSGNGLDVNGIAKTRVGGAIFNTTSAKLTISDSLFKNNAASSQGGAINNFGTLTINSGTEFNQNKAISSTTDVYSGAIYNSATLNINSGVTFINNATVSSSGGARSGAIFNDTTGILSITGTTSSLVKFLGNYTSTSNTTSYGGAIANFGTNTSNSISYADFEYNGYSDYNPDNTSYIPTNITTAQGGAIYNTGTLTITDSTFKNNAVNNQGGAIFNNSGTINIQSTAGGSTLFSGNKANNISNAIQLCYNSKVATLNLNTGEDGKITFDDAITSDNRNNPININDSAAATGLTTGTIIFNNLVSNSSIALKGGTLTLGQDNNSITHTYMSNVNLTLNAGTLDMQNNYGGDIVNLYNLTIPTNSTATLTIDADFANNKYDSIAVSGAATGTLTINDIKILSELSGSTTTIAVVSGGNLTNLAALPTKTIITTLAEYVFTQNATTKGTYDVLKTLLAGLNYAVRSTSTPRTFEATADTDAEYALGTMGGANSTLTINGNSNSINGLGYAGITVLSGQTLSINNVGSLNTDGTVKTSWNGFSSTTDGGVISNAGNLSITNSAFSNNTSTGKGGVLYNNTASNITSTISGSTFASNHVTTSGGAIYNNSGILTITDTDFIGNYTTSITAGEGYGGAIYNHDVIQISQGSTFSGNGIGTDGSVKTRVGGAIYNDTTGKTSTIDDTKFENNASASGGAVYNKAGTLQITNTDFMNNYVGSASSGGAIYNIGNLLISEGSTFIGNGIKTETDKSTVRTGYGGAICNLGTATIKDTTFTGNKATAAGGAIYNQSGTLNIQASAGNTTDAKFSGNKANDVSNAIHLEAGILNLNAGEGGKITFDDKITSANRDNVININYSGAEESLTSGTIIFNNTVSDASIKLYDGVLSLGEDNNTTTNTYLSNVNLTLSGGVLDMRNQNASDVLEINNLTITDGSTAVISIDTDFANNEYDKINLSGTASGKLQLASVNIKSDSELENFLVQFINLNSGASVLGLTLEDYIAYTDDYEYDFSQSTTAGAYNVDRIDLHPTTGLNSAISSTAKTRSFSANSDETVLYALGDMGGTNSTLTIYGNNHNINGVGYGGVNVLSGQTLNILNANSWNGFVSAYGGAINNVGTTTIIDSVFKNNKATGLGGAIYNAGTLNIQATVGNTTTFSGNTDSTGANAIYLASGSILNLNAGTGGSITFNDAITSESVNNAININDSDVNSSIVNGTVNFNNKITNAKVNIKSGSVNVAKTTVNNAKFTMTGGTTTFNNTTFGSNSNIFVNGASAQTILSGITQSGLNYSTTDAFAKVAAGTLNVSNSTFSSYSTATQGGVINNAGTTTITNSSFTNNSSTSQGGAIYNTGTLNVVANGANTTFTNNKAASALNDIYLASGSTLNINAGNGGAVYINSGITSENINNEININNTNSTYPTTGSVVLNSAITNSTVKMYNGGLILSNDSYLNGDNLAMLGGTLGLANGLIETAQLENVTLTNSSYFTIDADLAKGLSDRITATNVTSINGGSLTLSGLNLLSDISSQANLSIADTNLSNYINLGVTNISSPISNYNLSYNSSSGNLSVVNAGFNPSIIATPSSALVGTYLTQTNTYHEAFANIDSIMSVPRYDRLLMRYKNKTADAKGNFVFSPTMLPEEQQGYWVKEFTTFENVPLRNGPNVSNVAYGMLIGKDSEIKYLGKGFSGYTSAYVGYTGSRQNYDNVSSNQNGGLIGITETVYKNDFFAALTLNAGASNGNNYTPYGIDNYTTMMAGIAAKTGYNYETLGGKLIIQPSLTVSYTFADTFDYTTAAGVNVTSDPLNAIQVIPGLKFIGNLKNGWQPYIGTNLVCSFMDSTKFYANNVELPQTSVDPYIEYGFGLQRKWGGRFTGFGQAMARSGGRNGVALQFGFRVGIGK